MKLTTITIPAIEMTWQEEQSLWESKSLGYDIFVDGKKVIHWNTSDGNNEMLLDGETIFRTIVTN